MKFLFGAINTVLLAGAVVMMTFLVLLGLSHHSPINQFYWMRAEGTHSISGAPTNFAFTTWGACEYADGKVTDKCTRDPVGMMQLPVDVWKTEQGVPEDFIKSQESYYYLSRFGFAFLLIAYATGCFAFLFSVASMGATHADRGLVPLVFLFFVTLVVWAALVTAVTVKAKNHLDGNLLPKGFGLMWTSMFLSLLVLICTIVGIAQTKKEHHYEAPVTADGEAEPEVKEELSFRRGLTDAAENDAGGIHFFKIKRDPKPDTESE